MIPNLISCNRVSKAPVGGGGGCRSLVLRIGIAALMY